MNKHTLPNRRYKITYLSDDNAYQIERRYGTRNGYEEAFDLLKGDLSELEENLFAATINEAQQIIDTQVQADLYKGHEFTVTEQWLIIGIGAPQYRDMRQLPELSVGVKLSEYTNDWYRVAA